jgi:Na+-driven multidrug efflux pump
MQNQTVHKNQLSHFFSLVRRSIRGDEYDYTQGSIRAAIVLLAVPMILELVLESVFAVVDMYFVSHMHQGAKQAMATVGLTESVISIVYTLGFGVSMAATAVVARRIGEKNNEGAAHAGAQAILIGIAVSVVLSIAGVIFAPSVLKLMGAAPDVIAEGAPFARIMFGSSLVIIMLFLINGVYRGAGDAAMAMRSLWIASGINIILCPFIDLWLWTIPRIGIKRGCYCNRYWQNNRSYLPMLSFVWWQKDYSFSAPSF